MTYTKISLIPWVSGLLLALFSSLGVAQTVHISHCLAGCPVSGLPDNEVVVRHLFAGSVEKDSGLAEWVAYRVISGSVGIASLLPRYWAEDRLINSEVVEIQLKSDSPSTSEPEKAYSEENSYRTSEITISLEDRGRLVPMTSFAGTPYWGELNLLTNMAPIPTDLRIGSWSRLDQSVNELAGKIEEVFVVSGPLYETGDLTPLEALSKVRASSFFKVVATKTSIAAFIFPENLPSHSNYCDFRSTLGLIESQSGLKLFPRRQQEFSSDLFGELRCVRAK